VKRGSTLAVLVACGLAGLLCATAFSLAPFAVADIGTGDTATVPPTSTLPATTTTPIATQPVTTAPITPKPTVRGPSVIAAGVTVGKILVGGLSPKQARELVQKRFHRSLTLVASPTRKIRVEVAKLGARAYLGDAIDRARISRAGAVVPLKVEVSRPTLERYVRRLASDLDRDPVDARVLLRNLKPVVKADSPGRRLKALVTQRLLMLDLKTHVRDPIGLPFDPIRPKVTISTIGKAIVIRRGSNKLFLYDREKLVRVFKVATGQSIYPTPIGAFEIIVMSKNPWWYPPDSAWAEGEEPVPPGPSNPLGTRWMGISSPYVGIHGTPNAASIGYSQSHGCIRMLIPEAEWLFEHVTVGTPVYIVPA
jgi:lipoprotein-anchoring transpeptidase ErfK/SrfK